MEYQNSDKYKEAVQWLNDRTTEYDAGNPTVTDEEWDNIYFLVQNYEYFHRNKIDPASPTQKISYTMVNELKKVKHNHPMLSLAKTKDMDEVKSFIGDKPYVVMAKMDGLTCSLHYEGGKLISAETRGDGIIGENITHNAMVIPSIPKKIPVKKSITIDGEIICTYKDFEKWSGEYKNPRNFAAGSIRLLDSNECATRDLTFIAWDIIDLHSDLSTKLSLLIDWCFEVVPFYAYCDEGFTDVLVPDKGYMQEICKDKGYPIDGLVYKYDNIDTYEKAGRTDHHFRGGLAYKFYDETYNTKLKWIEWSMGRTGILTPVAIFEPIDIDGSTIERASLHNVSVMHETLGDCAYIGEPLKVYRANMIIPQIAEAGPKFTWDEVVKHNGASANDCPEFCPICQAATTIQRSGDGVENLVCTNPQCEGKLINRLDHFCGKKGLDIKGLSEKTLEKLIDWEWVNDITDIPKLKEHRTEWISKPGFGEASVDKILKGIDDAFAEAPLWRFISGLGIPLIGTTVAKQICEKVETWNEFKELINTNFDFTNWNGFGYEMNKSLHDFDYSEADKIVESITFKIEEAKETTNNLQDKTFVITGKLVKYKNRQELIDKITSAGGKVQSSVSAKTMYLICNDLQSTSGKTLKAKALNIHIITEEDLLQLMNKEL